MKQSIISNNRRQKNSLIDNNEIISTGISSIGISNNITNLYTNTDKPLNDNTNMSIKQISKQNQQQQIIPLSNNNTSKGNPTKEIIRERVFKRRNLKAKIYQLVNKNYNSICGNFLNNQINRDIALTEVLKSSFYIKKQAILNTNFRTSKPNIPLVDEIKALNFNSEIVDSAYKKKLSELFSTNFTKDEIESIRDDYRYFLPNLFSFNLNIHQKKSTLLDKINTEDNVEKYTEIHRNDKNRSSFYIKQSEFLNLKLIKKASIGNIESDKNEIETFTNVKKYQFDAEENNIRSVLEKRKHIVIDNFNSFINKSTERSKLLMEKTNNIESKRNDYYNKQKIILSNMNMNRDSLSNKAMRLPYSCTDKNSNTKKINYESKLHTIENVKKENIKVDHFLKSKSPKNFLSEVSYINCLMKSSEIRDNYKSKKC